MAEVSPARFVADADVLAADVLVGGPARAAIDLARAHDWVGLVASERLLEEAASIVAELGTRALAEAWLDLIADHVEIVDIPSGDHPALAAAVAGNAAHVLTFDEDLSSAGTNLSLQGRVDVSIRPPDAFVSLFDPASLYEHVVGGAYPGPDHDPRA